MIPYFSIIDNPGEIIVLCLVLALCVSLSSLAYMLCTDKIMTKLEFIVLIIVVPTAFMSLLWILIGDSTEWSKPIGMWLRGR